MENKEGYYFTNKGRAMIAELIAAKPATLVISRVMVGSGKVPEGADPKKFTDLIAPVKRAAFTEPLAEGDTVSLTVQYSNDMDGGLEEGFHIHEYGIFARGMDNKEYLIFYGYLGEEYDPMPKYINGRITVREYPTTLIISEGVDVVIEIPADAYLTYAQMVEYVRVKMLPMFMEEFKKLLAIHNMDEEAHPPLRARIDKLEGRIKRLEDMFLTNVKKNAYAFTFKNAADLAKVTILSGVWNESLEQIEW